MKKIVIIIAIIVSIVIAGIVLLINKLDSDVEIILETEIIDIDLAKIEDGIYVGEYDEAFAVNARIQVTIEDHVITDIIILEHNNGQGQAAESIINDFKDNQSIDVDDIAGATYSSRVLKLAVIDALKGE